MKHVITFKLNGEDVTLDVGVDTAAGDIDQDMETIASKIAWYGECLAAAEASATIADTNYRTWRATTSRNTAARQPQAPEHKLKAAVEADPAFGQHKERIAHAEALVTKLKYAVIALQVKAQILPSRGAKARDELRATGMSTRTVRETVDESGEQDIPRMSRQARLRERTQQASQLTWQRRGSRQAEERDSQHEEEE